MAELFDKCIDLVFYDESGNKRHSILCNESGQKPEITIDTTLLSIDMAISTIITVTNLDRNFPIYDMYWIKATLYYNGPNVSKDIASKEGRELLLYVEWADQSKGPPDRQVQFHCLRASMAPGLIQTRIKLEEGLYDKDTKTNLTISFKRYLYMFIEEYNKQVKLTYANNEALQSWCQLNSEPLCIGKAKEYVTEDVTPGKFEGSLIYGLEQLGSLINDTEKVSKAANSKSRRYPAVAVFIEDHNLVVVPTVNNNEDLTEGLAITERVKVSNAVSLYRVGNVVHLTMLFDPRISHRTAITVPTFNLGGKMSLSRQTGEDLGDEVTFLPIAGIKVKFGTVEQNKMEITGVI